MQNASVGALRKRWHGQHIYAYCHVGTQQVLYSLNQSLQNNRVLKQLPDAGANNKPTALRKDLWKPFFTISLPEPQEPSSRPDNEQGLEIYKKLLEWRKLHETYWKPSPLLSRPYTAEELEEFKEKLENRGGAKKMSPLDMAKREKKKMRMREVMNQKANSVADLAAVLLEQEVSGAEMAEKKAEDATQRRERNIEVLKTLWRRFENGDLGQLEQRKEELEAGLRESEAGQAGTNKAEVNEQLRILRREIWQMKYAVSAVETVRDMQSGALDRDVSALRVKVEAMEARGPEENDSHDLPEYRHTADEVFRLIQQISSTEASEQQVAMVQQLIQRRAELRKAIGLPSVDSSATVSESGGQPAASQMQSETWEAMEPYLPGFPRRDPDMNSTPKRGTGLGRLKWERKVPFTTEGIRIAWQQPLDAEYAEAWPENVEHTWIGFTRHTAPLPEAEIIGSAEEFAERSLQKMSVNKARRKRAALQSKRERQAEREGFGSEPERGLLLLQVKGEQLEKTLQRRAEQVRTLRKG